PRSADGRPVLFRSDGHGHGHGRRYGHGHRHRYGHGHRHDLSRAVRVAVTHAQHARGGLVPLLRAAADHGARPAA
ncbi:hypothetical protein FNX44_016455, partial [Streptomyces sp. OF1]|nr:hypothetical protein [Streptomyces alkaliterrae]